ncbi:uncharacterized protein BX663DRAFT_500164 [Cokeromyces recurvatus]|uniref:uncharacterized protein n=1 Tax=Cokeromyces recurvatus TaxID=90255 RepID=UPI00221F068B|nr:uncharacterized protein BX663DRAFT_500164 [Cokeromyces recurvatus]KAI7905567.1 hypothetical protein BX663DRAFT_500164 [Cokeromyces recurvatus]
MKENKFVMGEEETTKGNTAAPSSLVPTHNATQPHKRPTRHHVKRRSSGRVHVTKLAPMVKTTSNHTDSEADLVDDPTTELNARPAIRRSQSQRSLHKAERKSFITLTSRRRSTTSSEKLSATSSTDPPEVKAHERKDKDDLALSYDSNTSITTHNNPVPLSSIAIAAPIEQPLNAIAHNLVFPKQASIYPNKFTETIKQQKHNNNKQHMEQQYKKKKPFLLRSHFDDSLHEAITENDKLNNVYREYQCIRWHQDPMQASLLRCIEKLDSSSLNKQTMTSCHLGQRQLAHRHHQLLKSSETHIQLNNKRNESNIAEAIVDDNYGFLATLFDKILYTSSPSSKS